jgi:hypothetical protein
VEWRGPCCVRGAPSAGGRLVHETGGVLGRLVGVIEALARRVGILELEAVYRRETPPRRDAGRS